MSSSCSARWSIQESAALLRLMLDRTTHLLFETELLPNNSNVAGNPSGLHQILSIELPSDFLQVHLDCAG